MKSLFPITCPNSIPGSGIRCKEQQQISQNVSGPFYNVWYMYADKWCVRSSKGCTCTWSSASGSAPRSCWAGQSCSPAPPSPASSGSDVSSGSHPAPETPSWPAEESEGFDSRVGRGWLEAALEVHPLPLLLKCGLGGRSYSQVLLY